MAYRESLWCGIRPGVLALSVQLTAPLSIQGNKSWGRTAFLAPNLVPRNLDLPRLEVASDWLVARSACHICINSCSGMELVFLKGQRHHFAMLFFYFHTIQPFIIVNVIQSHLYSQPYNKGLTRLLFIQFSCYYHIMHQAVACIILQLQITCLSVNTKVMSVDISCQSNNFILNSSQESVYYCMYY